MKYYNYLNNNNKIKIILNKVEEKCLRVIKY